MEGFWYSGSIPDAIAESKQTSKLFVVYITGSDENSQKMDKLWEDERIQSMCKSSCVTLKLDADSQACKQFSAIYPVLGVPTAYFINNAGKVLEAIAVQDVADDFVTKVAAVTKHIPGSSDGAGSSGLQHADDMVKRTTEKKSPEAESDKPKQAGEAESSEVDEFSKKLRKHKQKEEKDDAKYERQRREWGKSSQRMKEDLKEAQLKRDIEERKAKKLEEKAARERIKQQIEQDKLDRAATFKQEKDEREELKANRRAVKNEKLMKDVEAKNAERNSIARLQFRMPDGSTLLNQFNATDTLQSAYEFVVSQNIPKMSTINSFDLCLAYPRHIYTNEEKSSTYAELGMVPNASLIILPKRQGGSSSTPATNGLFSIFMFILMIPIHILSYIWRFLSGQLSAQGTNTPVHQEGQRSEEASHGRPGASSVRMRRPGHMSRLSDIQDDDDNATWNGNSTQQM